MDRRRRCSNSWMRAALFRRRPTRLRWALAAEPDGPATALVGPSMFVVVVGGVGVVVVVVVVVSLLLSVGAQEEEEVEREEETDEAVGLLGGGITTPFARGLDTAALGTCAPNHSSKSFTIFSRSASDKNFCTSCRGVWRRTLWRLWTALSRSMELNAPDAREGCCICTPGAVGHHMIQGTWRHAKKMHMHDACVCKSLWVWVGVVVGKEGGRRRALGSAR